METKRAVGIWVRVSTEDQAEGESPQHHEHRARYYAEAKGWQVVTVYHLEAVSGKSVMEHPEAKRMLKEVKEGLISALIFSKLARLARNTKELLEFADYFKEYDADLVSLQEAIDTSTPAGRLFYTIIAAMAQWEREEIASRVAASVPIRAKLGKPLGGAAPFGYKWAGDATARRFELDEKEAPIRKLMYELFLKFKRKKTTADALNRKGYRTRNNSLFTEPTIDRLIRDPVAMGIRRANYTKSTGEGKKWVIKPSDEWVHIECPPLITEEVWNECNQYLNARAKLFKKAGRKSEYLLAGFVTCNCGRKMYVYHGCISYTCKGCKNKIAVADIDHIFYEYLQKYLLADGDASKFMEQSESLIQEKEALLQQTDTDAKELRQKMDELVTMRMNKELPSDRFTIHYKPLEERLTALEQQKPELEAEIAYLKVQAESSDTILEQARDLCGHWPEMPLEEKRGIVELIAKQLVVGVEDVTVKLQYRPLNTPTFQNPGTNPHHFMDSSRKST